MKPVNYAPYQRVIWFDGKLEEGYEGESYLIGCNETREGSGISKHRAIMHATGDIIVLIDAHMILPVGWDRAVLDHFADPAHARDVLCGQMIPMEEWGIEAGPPKTGAEIVLKSHARDGFVALRATWKDQPVGEIGCCIGAFYAFRREWYEAIGAPLGVTAGWGAEEEMLSLGSWIMGGRVVLADIRAAHLMGKLPHVTPPGWYGKMWRNRFRLVNVLPLDPVMRRDLNDWLWNNPIKLAPSFVESVSADAMRPEVIELKRLWSSKAASWAAYCERFLNVKVRAPVPQMQAEPRAESVTIPPANSGNCQVIDLIKCPKCGHVDEVRITKTIPAATGTKRYGHCANKACRKAFTAIDRDGTRRVYWRK